MEKISEIEKFYYSEIDDELLQYTNYFSRGVISDIPRNIFEEDKYIPLREYAIYHMGFSVVTKKNCYELKKIIKSEKVLEIMCGVGSYTATLRDCGIDVIATDNMSWVDGEDKKYKDWKKYTWISDIEKIDAISAIIKYGKSVGFILMSWPPQYEDVALEALLTMRYINPECKMIYIGEWMGGCTANDKFFENAIDISKKYINTSNFKSTYRAWHNDSYYDEQYIII